MWFPNQGQSLGSASFCYDTSLGIWGFPCFRQTCPCIVLCDFHTWNFTIMALRVAEVFSSTASGPRWGDDSQHVVRNFCKRKFKVWFSPTLFAKDMCKMRNITRFPRWSIFVCCFVVPIHSGHLIFSHALGSIGIPDLKRDAAKMTWANMILTSTVRALSIFQHSNKIIFKLVESPCSFKET